MDMASLDAQEGVHLDWYVPLIKDVHTPDGEVLECRLYKMSVAPTNKLKLNDSSAPIPHERKPSKSLYFHWILAISVSIGECYLILTLFPVIFAQPT